MSDVHFPIQPDEAAVPTTKGQFIVFQSAQANRVGTEYVRFVDSHGNELLYYDKQEWADEPEEVMGCIMGAIQHGADRADAEVA